MGPPSPQETLVERLRSLTRDFDPPGAYWVWDVANRFVCENYCPDHIGAAVASAGVSGLWCDDPTLEPPHEDGGYKAACVDCSIACATCGKTLAYTLSDFGALEELNHFMEAEGPLSPEQAYELLAAVEAVEDLTAHEATRLLELANAPLRCEAPDA